MNTKSRMNPFAKQYGDTAMITVKKLLVLCLCFALVFPSVVLAAPVGGQVVGGQASISQSGATTRINQASNRSIINWNSFNIAPNEVVIHTMPSPLSASLYRVVGGGGASQIEGLLQSNGNIYLVNPAGVVIHNGARVETGGFVASTADISNKNFMQGNYVFNKPGQPGASIVNQGTISVRDSGFAALVAPSVRNNGIIAAKLGKVALASGDSFKLDVYGDDLIAFTTPEKIVDTLHTVNGAPVGVENKGQIKAEGGTVLLTAKQLDGVVSSVVSNSGVVSAASAEMVGGRIVFKAEGVNVDVVNTGTVDASSGQHNGGSVRMTGDAKVSSSGTIAATGGNLGGSVVLTGNEVALTDKATIDASGNQGGGMVLVGGSPQGKGPEKNAAKTSVGADVAIKADAINSGNGGQVVVWSDGNTKFDGTISAKGGKNGGNGGQVETSGAVLKVGDTARVDASAVSGKAGTWLLDPTDFTIAAGTGDTDGATLSNSLNSGTNITIQSSGGASGTNGDIFVNDAVSWSSNSVLTLSAYRDVNINANISATGATAGLNIAPGTGTTGAFNLASGVTVTLSGANPFLSIFGHPYTVINSVEALQDMNGNGLAGYCYYALGSDINASGTNSWNGGAGFVPIGDYADPIAVVFHGLGHTITDLTINRPATDNVGLFGATRGSQIYNIGLVNANITGANAVGALVGYNTGYYIFNSYSTGMVTGGSSVGGLVGDNSSEIYNCYSACAVNGNNSVGGLVGYNRYNISNSYSIGAVTGGDTSVGGFVGVNDHGNISDSYSAGAVTGSNYSVGGFVGLNKDYGNISNCYSDGAVKGSSNVGGFVGANAGLDGYGNISNSYSTGTVKGDSYVGGFIGFNGYDGHISSSYSTGAVVGGGDYVGGFAGDNYLSCIISDSYSTGTVTVAGGSHVGGFVGFNEVSSYIKNSYSTGAVNGSINVGGFAGGNYVASLFDDYWDTQASGQTVSAGGTGLNTTQMKAKASFANWDFDNIWSIAEGLDYPKLRNVGLSGSVVASGMMGSTTSIPNPPSGSGTTNGGNTITTPPGGGSTTNGGSTPITPPSSGSTANGGSSMVENSLNANPYPAGAWDWTTKPVDTLDKANNNIVQPQVVQLTPELNKTKSDLEAENNEVGKALIDLTQINQNMTKKQLWGMAGLFMGTTVVDYLVDFAKNPLNALFDASDALSWKKQLSENDGFLISAYRSALTEIYLAKAYDFYKDFFDIYSASTTWTPYEQNGITIWYADPDSISAMENYLKQAAQCIDAATKLIALGNSDISLASFSTQYGGKIVIDGVAGMATDIFSKGTILNNNDLLKKIESKVAVTSGGMVGKMTTDKTDTMYHEIMQSAGLESASGTLLNGIPSVLPDFRVAAADLMK